MGIVNRSAAEAGMCDEVLSSCILTAPSFYQYNFHPVSPGQEI
jgi:hypothetical protein